MRFFIAVYYIPYFIAWVFLGIYLFVKHVDVNTNPYSEESIKFRKELIDKNIVIMEKIKPHVINITWILILLIILR